jgi:hypothetical protein
MWVRQWWLEEQGARTQARSNDLGGRIESSMASSDMHAAHALFPLLALGKERRGLACIIMRLVPPYWSRAVPC